MVRLNRQLSCRCKADNFPREEGSNTECSRSRHCPSASSWSLPCTDALIGLRLALCCTMSGIPRQFLMVKGAFSFKEESQLEAAPSENT